MPSIIIYTPPLPHFPNSISHRALQSQARSTSPTPFLPLREIEIGKLINSIAMLGRTKPKPMIGILTGSLSPTRSASLSPKSHSPKPFDLGAVGLGIVAALDTSGDIPANRALFTRSLSRSSPIPVKNCFRNSEDMVTESFEEYRTVVTCHGPNESYTKVYGDGRRGDDRSPFRIPKTGVVSRKPSVFHISPPKIGDCGGVPPPDFLSSCNLCHKKLHGKDIYMYRGEKAFCSTECRYRQIVVDERTEKCSSEKATMRAVEVAASSPYANGGQMFATGILAI